MDDLFWATDITPLLNDATAFVEAAASLPRSRKDRVLQIRPIRERCLSLCGSLLLLDALREYGIQDPVFSYGEQGKPFLSDFSEIHFNISHAGDYAVCAVSDRPVGCDIERIKPYRTQLSERVLSHEEKLLLSEQKEESGMETVFFRFWTLKESFLKALGCGISVPLPSVSFDLTGETPVVSQTITGDDYFFHEYEDLPGYRCSLCKKDSGIFPPLIIKHIYHRG